MSSTTPSTAVTRTILRAEGFSCPSCVAKIEKQVGRLAGVSAVTVQFASSRIEIDHDPQVVGVEALIAAVAKAGYASTAAAF
ncbi:heavy-metal-associated domain-containing protein [Cellulomonas sp. P22]|uniref:heavy-metal-associated domain-containing protein n=1 Tax=Cellulomonas sp. P22 TaxID=3373189 RepID=UPI003797DCA5